MPGCPIRRARQAAVRDANGEVVAFPFLTKVSGADKPRGWSRWSAAEKVEYLLGLSVDRMHDYLSWPPDGLDPYRLAAQTQVIRVVAMVAPKAGGEAARERERHRIIEELTREEFGTSDEA